MLKRTSFSLLILRVALFLIFLWATFKAILTGSERGWQLYGNPPNPMNTSVEMKHNRTDVLETNHTIVETITVPSKQIYVPFVFKPSSYAYVFYTTSDLEACAILVNINRLRNHFFTRHRIHVLISYDVSDRYVRAITSAQATVTIIDRPPISNTSHWDVDHYKGYLLKFLAFGLHEIDNSFKRIILMDADQLILQELDHIFDLPQTDLAAPRADWIARDIISSTFMVISLSDRVWNTVKTGLETVEPSMNDMDLINKLFANNVLVLPTSFAALNELWYSWTTPDWYRPEEVEKHKEEKDPDEIDALTAERFWHAISIMSESNPFAEDSAAGESDKNHNFPLLSEPRLDRRIRKRSLDTTHTFDTETTLLVDVGAEADDTIDFTTHSTDNTATSVMYQTTPPFKSTSTTSEPTTASGPRSSATSAPHNSTDALVTLYKYNAKILHFANSTKPWMWNVKRLKQERPGGHPLFYQQWRTWRKEANEVCPTIGQMLLDYDLMEPDI